ncbi:MAG: phage tail sheath C-terminal domain-containing protein [Fluviicola sp.]|nr:phage tail sheath C-terminal domain-containing protein [Fluviicola sp.]
MATTYRTPDVYIEETSTLPPSVAEVSTAIPAFLGYTEKVTDPDGEDLTYVPTRINTLLDYTAIFGNPDLLTFTATTNAANELISVEKDSTDQQHRMYYALDHYFKNGGGTCYVVSLGAYKAKDKGDFTKGLAALEKEDEPTLIILSEATTLSSQEYHDLCQDALNQCEKLKDRFCIFDVLNDKDGVKNFRNIVNNNLKYGAAYYPFLQTSIVYQYNEDSVTVKGQTAGSTTATFTFSTNAIKVEFTGPKTATPTLEVKTSTKTSITFDRDAATNKLTVNLAKTAASNTGKAISDAFTAWGDAATSGFKITSVADAEVQAALDVTALTAPAVAGGTTSADKKLTAIRDTSTTLYNAIKTELAKMRVVLPASPAVAGVYATVDRSRGVWKAPANVAINSVVNPMIKISALEQESLNIDEDSGKSINAIRTFVGKGTLIWGARTLAGNDNEWRYVPVRRLFNMIEESSKKASAFAVFEPNDPSTWLKVKGMLDSYLYGLWQQGALAGSKPEAAYFVHVGLGKTMTQQDILEGRMIIEIGIAAVRPAEFIILRFSHKLQEA